ncbi:glycoside hydrolase family 18 protein [Plantibacter flavus]|uniref:glycoside hydrolase family 18 protein n=1 Tax=Plantibacter flavus TaxID=150123 RepID=UPI003F14D626
MKRLIASLGAAAVLSTIGLTAPAAAEPSAAPEPSAGTAPALTVDRPTVGGTVDADASGRVAPVFSGTATPGSTVRIVTAWQDDVGSTQAANDGSWNIEWDKQLLPARYVGGNTIASVDGVETARVRYDFTVAQQPVALTSPKVGDTLDAAGEASLAPTFSGTGVNGARILIVGAWGTELATTTVENGTWSAPWNKSVAPGRHAGGLVKQYFGDKLHSTTPYDFTIVRGEKPEPAPAQRVVGYVTEWGVYDRDYHVKDLVTSGSAEKLTHILYGFANTAGGQCSMGDEYASTQKTYTAEESVDGIAMDWADAEAGKAGNFGQLLRLKAMYPHLKVLYSVGGWTWSAGFGEAMKDPAKFAESCKKLLDDERYAGLFDGIDIDWEYPNACGATCDTSGPDSFDTIISAIRDEFGPDRLVTAATTADGSDGGNIDKANYGAAIDKLDWLMPMTYDYFGAWDATGPTAPHSPLSSYPGVPKEGFNTQAAFEKMRSQGIPAEKLLLGIGFYGRGWTGVTQSEPGGSATGAALGKYEPGIQDYKLLKQDCPVTGTVGGSAYAHCGSDWWSYDTAETIATKVAWAQSQGMGGTFIWELSGDTEDGELITAIADAQS